MCSIEGIIGGGKGGARGLKPPLRMISHRNYLSWSGAENRDKVLKIEIL